MTILGNMNTAQKAEFDAAVGAAAATVALDARVSSGQGVTASALAGQAAAQVAGRARGYYPIACRASFPYARSTLNAQNARMRTKHILPFGCSEIMLVYGGFRMNPAEGALNPTSLTATTSNGTANLTAVSGALVVGKPIYGGPFPLGTFVLSYSSGAGTAVLSSNATATQSATLTQGYDVVGMHVGLEPVWDTQASWTSAPAGAYSTAIKKVSKDGMTELVIPSEGLLRCDPVPVLKNPGEAIGIRAWMPANNGLLSRGCNYSGLGESGTKGTLGDTVWTSALAAGGAGAAAFVPVAILGRTADGKKPASVALWGDSNMYSVTSVSAGGTGFDTLDAQGNAGWAERALGNSLPFTNASAPGDGFKFLLSDGYNGTGRQRRMNALRDTGYTHCLLGLSGTNDTDVFTSDQIIGSWKTLLQELKGLGMKVIAVTPLPKESGGVGVQILADVASYMRSNAVSDGAEWLVDLRSLAVSSADTTKWRTDLALPNAAPATYDGVHPSQEMLEYLAAQVTAQGMLSVGKFVV